MTGTAHRLGGTPLLPRRGSRVSSITRDTTVKITRDRTDDLPAIGEEFLYCVKAAGSASGRRLFGPGVRPPAGPAPKRPAARQGVGAVDTSMASPYIRAQRAAPTRACRAGRLQEGCHRVMSVPRIPLTPAESAAAINSAMIANVRKRAESINGVLGPCLRSYEGSLESVSDRHPLHDLTKHLVETVVETEASIRTRMVEKWEAREGTASQIEKSVTNSMRRSAGTNYQALVSYALARYLLEASSYWYVVHPVPADFGNSLAIRFTAGVAPEPSDTILGLDDEIATEADETVSGDVTVKPDLDILIRNAAWNASSAEPEPILILSVKTSLADRAGSAARWKTYFDLVTRPCAHVKEEDCAYRRLGIELAYDPNVDITHGIVTANIYKINSDPMFARWGELRSNQARANTFMFDLRYTTRNDSEDVMAEGWSSLADLPSWLAGMSSSHGLPS
jgi:hypothetical protein